MSKSTVLLTVFVFPIVHAADSLPEQFKLAMQMRLPQYSEVVDTSMASNGSCAITYAVDKEQGGNAKHEGPYTTVLYHLGERTTSSFSHVQPGTLFALHPQGRDLAKMSKQGNVYIVPFNDQKKEFHLDEVGPRDACDPMAIKYSADGKYLMVRIKEWLNVCGVEQQYDRLKSMRLDLIPHGVTHSELSGVLAFFAYRIRVGNQETMFRYKKEQITFDCRSCVARKYEGVAFDVYSKSKSKVYFTGCGTPVVVTAKPDGEDSCCYEVAFPGQFIKNNEIRVDKSRLFTGYNKERQLLIFENEGAGKTALYDVYNSFKPMFEVDMLSARLSYSGKLLAGVTRLANTLDQKAPAVVIYRQSDQSYDGVSQEVFDVDMSEE